MTATTAPRARYELGEVVELPDANRIAGVIEIVTDHGDGMTVYGVRSYDGTLYGRTADELVLASEARATIVRGDFRQLAERHEDLRGAARVLAACDRARGHYFATPEQHRIVFAGVPLALLPSPVSGATILSTLDGRFEIVQLAAGDGYVLRRMTRHATARADRGGVQLAQTDSIHDCAALIARLLGIAAPTAAEELLADVEHDEAHELLSRIKIDGCPAVVTEMLNRAELLTDAAEHLLLVREAVALDERLRHATVDPARGEAEQIAQIGAWLARHDIAPCELTAERVLDARADDERLAYVVREPDAR